VKKENQDRRGEAASADAGDSYRQRNQKSREYLHVGSFREYIPFPIEIRTNMA
jgi:hypothetical protein